MAVDLRFPDIYQPSPEKPVLLFIEGKNPLHFIHRVYRPGPIALLDFGSVSALRDRLTAACAARNFFQYVKRVAVIRDAEGGDAMAAQSVKDAFIANGLSSSLDSGKLSSSAHRGISTAFLILPHGRQTGCFEHALLESIPEGDRRRCVETFINCVPQPRKEADWAMDNWKAKAMVHALIAVSEKPELTLGESGAARLWDVAHPSLKALGDFLNMLSTGL